jgi:Ser/Thr protein kinase RdoA (MazF antagonist)
MNDSPHLAHGLAGDNIAPDWPPLQQADVAALLHGYPQAGKPLRIRWRSPRPLSAACVVEAKETCLFVKRHHRSVRTPAVLAEEHRFIAWLRAAGMPIPDVLADRNGQTAVAMGDWVYEVHECAVGLDIYREAISWSPPLARAHARTAGTMLARLHNAAEGYDALQRSTHLLVARSELIAAVDPVDFLRAQLPQRPGLADYLQACDWAADLSTLLAPWHAALQPQLAVQPPLWTHGDWHVSNLCWSDNGSGARISDVLDFGLSAANCALFDLATAIERNAVSWLAIDTGQAAVHVPMAMALIEGYRQLRPLPAADLHVLANLLPLVHVDFALSEVEYFHAVTHSRANADVAYETFLCGHAAWFLGAPGQSLLQAIRDAA